MAVKVESLIATEPAASGNQDLTIAGFGTPQIALFLWGRCSSAGTKDDDAHLYFGATDGTRQFAIGMAGRDGRNPSEQLYYQDDAVLCTANQAGGPSEYASFVSWITNGIRISWTGANVVQREFCCILINGLNNAYVGYDTVNTVNTEYNITSPGFRPQLSLLAALYGVSADAESFGTSQISFGAVGRKNAGTILQCGFGKYVEHGANPTEISTRIYNDRVLGVPDDTGSSDWEIEASNFDASGYSLTPRVNGGSTRIFHVDMDFDSSVNDIFCQIIDTPTATGNETYSGLGVTHKASFWFQTLLESVDSSNTGANSESHGIGVIGTDDNERSQSARNDDGVNPTNTENLLTSNTVSILDDSGNTSPSCTYVSETTDELTVNFSSVEGNSKKWIIAGFGERSGRVHDFFPFFGYGD